MRFSSVFLDNQSFRAARSLANSAPSWTAIARILRVKAIYATSGSSFVYGRDTLWLDIRALYRVHNQTVTLFFEASSAN